MLARLLAQVLSLIFPLRADEAIVAELAPDTLLAQLDPELVPLGEGMGAASLLSFNDERVRALVHEAKYRGNSVAFALLALVLTEYLREVVSESFVPTNYVLVPVPLGAKRRAERGYNQVEEVLKIVSRELCIPIDASLLLRTRETLSQVSLPRRKRLANMKGAFSCTERLDTHTTYIVLDDVLTTGATLSAACTALQESGATNILAVALAH